MLIAIDGRRLLVGVGENAAPSISTFDEVRRLSPRVSALATPQMYAGQKGGALMCPHLALLLIEPSSLPSLHALTGIKDNNSVPWTIVGILTC